MAPSIYNVQQVVIMTVIMKADNHAKSDYTVVVFLNRYCISIWSFDENICTALYTEIWLHFVHAKLRVLSFGSIWNLFQRALIP